MTSFQSKSWSLSSLATTISWEAYRSDLPFPAVADCVFALLKIVSTMCGNIRAKALNGGCITISNLYPPGFKIDIDRHMLHAIHRLRRHCEVRGYVRRSCPIQEWRWQSMMSKICKERVSWDVNQRIKFLLIKPLYELLPGRNRPVLSRYGFDFRSDYINKVVVLF